MRASVQAQRGSLVATQALAVMEAEDGHLRKARTYFAKSTRAQPRHMAAWQAWAIMEHQAGSPDRARCVPAADTVVGAVVWTGTSR